MKEMDENKKKIIILSIVIAVVILAIILGAFVIMPAISNYSAKKGYKNVINETSTESNEGTISLEEQAKQIFNMKFTTYETKEGETLTNTSVSMLFTALAEHNKATEERKVDVNGTIVTSENIEELRQILTSDLKYTVKCVYDNEGYVKTIELRYVQSGETPSDTDNSVNETANNNSGSNTINDNENEAKD